MAAADRSTRGVSLSAVPGTAGYGEEAPTLVERYESVVFERIHSDLLDLLPAPPARALDIGAGSGRDAAALAKRGYPVVAPEPTAELRRLGSERHAGLAIEWIDDALPELARLGARSERFDIALLTAVWMHLDAAERAHAMPQLAALLAPGAVVRLSLRYGPVPPGRRMFAVPAEEVIAAAAASGLALLRRGNRADVQGRADVRWIYLTLKKRAG